MPEFGSRNIPYSNNDQFHLKDLLLRDNDQFHLKDLLLRDNGPAVGNADLSLKSRPSMPPGGLRYLYDRKNPHNRRAKILSKVMPNSGFAKPFIAAAMGKAQAEADSFETQRDGDIQSAMMMEKEQQDGQNAFKALRSAIEVSKHDPYLANQMIAFESKRNPAMAQIAQGHQFVGKTNKDDWSTVRGPNGEMSMMHLPSIFEGARLKREGQAEKADELLKKAMVPIQKGKTEKHTGRDVKEMHLGDGEFQKYMQNSQTGKYEPFGSPYKKGKESRSTITSNVNEDGYYLYDDGRVSPVKARAKTESRTTDQKELDVINTDRRENGKTELSLEEWKNQKYDLNDPFGYKALIRDKIREMSNRGRAQNKKSKVRGPKGEMSRMHRYGPKVPIATPPAGFKLMPGKVSKSTGAPLYRANDGRIWKPY